MMEPHSVGYFAAFGYGLLSFVTPCVLPLVPVNIALISGLSVDALVEGRKSALWPTLSRTFLFIAGFSTVFALMGAGAGGVGHALQDYGRVIRIIGGAVVIVFGLHMTGLVTIDLFYRQSRRAHSFAQRQFGIVGVYLMGMSFAISWQPCVDPFLGSILALAASQGEVWHAVRLLLVYSAGLGLPFLLAAAAMGWFLKFSSRVKPALRAIEVGSGVLLLLLGLLLLTNKFVLVSQWAARLSAPTN